MTTARQVGRDMRHPSHPRPLRPRRVLVVDSPSGPTHEDAAALLTRNIDVLPYADGARALIGAVTGAPSMVVAPTDMVGVDVLHFVEALTAWGNVPVLVGLTSSTDSERRGFDALALGARALIALPFNGDQLLTVLHGIGSRSEPTDAVLRLGAITLDPVAHRVDVHGDPVHLTPKEFVLLERMMVEHPRVLPVGELAGLFGEGDSAGIASIRVLIARLRRKLDDASSPASAPSLQNVRGLGYRMAE
ncbi:response regulator transcription factor [Planctomonas psychrotolerans]|uniref:response regulator transcription factor n=1 Tax=Planctomonas psychrotolerans TaxID=2528712 RepID=UPI001238B010|nr:winged helix-turn-helix domain-containing protein [Planctomonas psychrotolerans]